MEEFKIMKIMSKQIEVNFVVAKGEKFFIKSNPYIVPRRRRRRRMKMREYKTDECFLSP